MKIAVMTDENSGISQIEAKEAGIFVLKMPVIIDEGEYFEGINLTHEEFYDALLSGKNVSTSMPSPGEVMEQWDRILDSGYDEIVYIPMSSGLSSSCDAASALAEDYDGKVFVVDNHRISVTLRQSVFDAVKLADEGKDGAAIKSILEEHSLDASIYITVDTLKFLVKSGRVTPAGAALGQFLNIKPILTIQGEKLDAFAKVRGMLKSESKMIEAIKKDLNTRFKDVPKDKIAMAAVSSFTDRSDIDRWVEIVKKEFPEMDVFYNHLSLSIGSHVGPNSVAIAITQILD